MNIDPRSYAARKKRSKTAQAVGRKVRAKEKANQQAGAWMAAAGDLPVIKTQVIRRLPTVSNEGAPTNQCIQCGAPSQGSHCSPEHEKSSMDQLRDGTF